MSQKSQPRFVFLLNHAHKALQRWIQKQPSAWTDISAAQVGMLFLIRSQGSVTVGEAASALQVAPAAITGLSKRMQAAGLIQRLTDDVDTRKICLTLTPTGEEASIKAKSTLQDLNQQLSDGFTKDELKVVARWLSQVVSLDHPADKDIAQKDEQPA
ncbi:MarR family transcriptional regulator [Alcaligenes sp. DN25]|uniref:MarR family winged helix-turn-helix transcriptional regulator n=1 Tax=Alcaligenes TaxID=507 RepID=UPI00202DDC88|nr:MULTISPECIES: MarR family transcriptional regulator [Alcaligenes]URW84413.1 MarR family transcriptional regulator [Alcaligenes sp. DN25]WEA69253.1 MarR family transcriptional regulator [Alcaligenes faecalis]